MSGIRFGSIKLTVAAVFGVADPAVVQLFPFPVSSPYFGYRFSKQDASPITELPALRRHRYGCEESFPTEVPWVDWKLPGWSAVADEMEKCCWGCFCFPDDTLMLLLLLLLLLLLFGVDSLVVSRRMVGVVDTVVLLLVVIELLLLLSVESVIVVPVPFNFNPALATLVVVEEDLVSNDSAAVVWLLLLDSILMEDLKGVSFSCCCWWRCFLLRYVCRRSRLENGLLLFGSVLVVLVGEEGDVLPGMSSALHVLLPLLAMPSSSSSSSSASTLSTTSIDCFLVGLSASSSSPLSVFPPPPESWNETIDSRSEGLVHTVWCVTESILLLSSFSTSSSVSSGIGILSFVEVLYSLMWSASTYCSDSERHPFWAYRSLPPISPLPPPFVRSVSLEERWWSEPLVLLLQQVEDLLSSSSVPLPVVGR